MRRKADGPEFEKEFKEAVEKMFYVRRLPTLNTGYSGLRQPADFIVIGDHFNYAELKETAGDVFSISQMQQYDMLVEFMKQKQEYRTVTLKGIVEMDFLVIVHFLKRNVIKVVDGKTALEMVAKKKALHYDSPEGMSFTSLNELVGGMIF